MEGAVPASSFRETPKKKFWNRKRKDLLFYVLMIAYPVLQFFVFYVGVNLNSILLAFQKIDLTTGTTTWTFDNFTNTLYNLNTSGMLSSMVSMSLIAYAISLFVGVPLGLLFSYYISKKFPLSNAFRVILFITSIISSIVMVTIYRFFVEKALPDIIHAMTGKTIKGLIENQSLRFWTISFYSLFISFGTSVLMYSNAMSQISPELYEAGKLDGATGLQEFWNITLPQVFPTVTTFLVIGVAGIFVNQMELFSFFGATAPQSLWTFGYYLYVHVEEATSYAEYPPVAALGIVLSLVAIPLTFLVKYLLERFGPSEDR